MILVIPESVRKFHSTAASDVEWGELLRKFHLTASPNVGEGIKMFVDNGKGIKNGGLDICLFISY